MIYKHIFKSYLIKCETCNRQQFFSNESYLAMSIVVNSNKVTLILDVWSKLMATQNQMEHNNNDEQNKEQYQGEISRKKTRLISPSSTCKNAEIVRPDIMIGVQTPIPLLCVCEFMMALSSRLSTQKK